jgi:hypothetical protein
VTLSATQPEFNESLFTELVRSCRSEKLPLCMGGDSNIMRNSSEKNIMRSLMKDGLSSLMQ